MHATQQPPDQVPEDEGLLTPHALFSKPLAPLQRWGSSSRWCDQAHRPWLPKAVIPWEGFNAEVIAFTTTAPHTPLIRTGYSSMPLMGGQLEDNLRGALFDACCKPHNSVLRAAGSRNAWCVPVRVKDIYLAAVTKLSAQQAPCAAAAIPEQRQGSKVPLAPAAPVPAPPLPPTAAATAAAAAAAATAQASTDMDAADLASTSTSIAISSVAGNNRRRGKRNTGSRYSSSSQQSDSSNCTADGALLSLEDNVATVVLQVKRPAVLQLDVGMSAMAVDFAAAVAAGQEEYVMLIAQTHRCMCGAGAHYGIMSSYSHTWYTRRYKLDPLILEVSPGIPWHQAGAQSATVLAATAMVAQAALQAPLRPPSLVPPQQQQEQRWTAGSCRSTVSGHSPGEQDSDDVHRVADQPPQQGRPHSPAKLQLSTAVLPALAVVPLWSLGVQPGDIAGYGRGGYVYNGSYRDTAVVVKMLPTHDWEPVGGFMWEAYVLTAPLAALQGSVVPRAKAHGYTSPAKDCYWLALERVAGSTLLDVPRPFSAQLKAAAISALEQVHEQGVLHNDIVPQNVMVRAATPAAGGEAGAAHEVVFIDFGRAEVSSVTAEEFAAEMSRLHKLLA